MYVRPRHYFGCHGSSSGPGSGLGTCCHSTRSTSRATTNAASRKLAIQDHQAEKHRSNKTGQNFSVAQPAYYPSANSAHLALRATSFFVGKGPTGGRPRNTKRANCCNTKGCWRAIQSIFLDSGICIGTLGVGQVSVPFWSFWFLSPLASISRL